MVDAPYILPHGRPSPTSNLTALILYSVLYFCLRKQVYIDGPYGAPSQHIFDSDHAVLIGAGIGITPFASILQSIHEQHKMATKMCRRCGNSWIEEAQSLLRVKKVSRVAKNPPRAVVRALNLGGKTRLYFGCLESKSLFLYSYIVVSTSILSAIATASVIPPYCSAQPSCLIIVYISNIFQNVGPRCLDRCRDRHHALRLHPPKHTRTARNGDQDV